MPFDIHVSNEEIRVQTSKKTERYIREDVVDRMIETYKTDLKKHVSYCELPKGARLKYISKDFYVITDYSDGISNVKYVGVVRVTRGAEIFSDEVIRCDHLLTDVLSKIYAYNACECLMEKDLLIHPRVEFTIVLFNNAQYEHINSHRG